MTLAQAIAERLTDDNGIHAALGGRCFRVSGRRMPAPASTPYLIWQVIGHDVPVALGDPTPESEDAVTVQFSVFGATDTEADAARAAVRTAFDHLMMPTGDIPHIVDSRDDYEDAVNLFRADLDISF